MTRPPEYFGICREARFAAADRAMARACSGQPRSFPDAPLAVQHHGQLPHALPRALPSLPMLHLNLSDNIGQQGDGGVVEHTTRLRDMARRHHPMQKGLLQDVSRQGQRKTHAGRLCGKFESTRLLGRAHAVQRLAEAQFVGQAFGAGQAEISQPTGFKLVNRGTRQSRQCGKPLLAQAEVGSTLLGQMSRPCGVLAPVFLYLANSALVTFGANRFDLLLVAPPSQSLEPPQFPGRFREIRYRPQARAAWACCKKKAPMGWGRRLTGGAAGIRTLDEALHPILP